MPSHDLLHLPLTNNAPLSVHPGYRGRGDRTPVHPAGPLHEAAGIAAGQRESRPVAHQPGAYPGVVRHRLERPAR